MYIKESDRVQLQRMGILPKDAKCLECDRPPDIIWHGKYGILLLCAEHAQYIGTQLVKDVRSFELAKGRAIKVRTELVERGQLTLADILEELEPGRLH